MASNYLKIPEPVSEFLLKFRRRYYSIDLPNCVQNVEPYSQHYVV